MDLPFVDSHCVEIEATPGLVWEQVVRTVPAMFEGRAKTFYAQVVGCHDVRRSPGPLSEGSTVAGFLVAKLVPEELLQLEGRHRFSNYALSFSIEETNGRVRLGAVTHAEFPGAPGKLYRTLVVGSRGHVILVRGMLNTVKKAAERRAADTRRA